jgi:serine/threonine-protein kinase PknG
MRSAATPCGRPDCRGGHIMETGFCDTCYRRPSREPLSVSAPAPPPPERPSQPTAPPAARLDGDGLLVLPFVPSPPPRDVVSRTARLPAGGRRCGVDNCVATIGVAHDGGPALDHGFCPRCGREYSFAPRLRPDDLVGGHYRVLGYLAVGGLGWVYLAEDTEVDDLHVVLKGLINTGGDEDRRLADEESRSLTTLHHRDIVRIVTSVDHQAPGERESTRYIVMEYVGGRSLDWIIRHASDEEPARLHGETFEFGHVLTYGCKILGALDHLHGRGLLYSDMKPANVIHYEREIKVIDLGAVRRIDDRRSRRVFTARYAPRRRERDERGFHIDTDLYTGGGSRKLGKQLKYADRRGARVAVIRGSDERAAGTVAVKDLASGDQATIDAAYLVGHVAGLLDR